MPRFDTPQEEVDMAMQTDGGDGTDPTQVGANTSRARTRWANDNVGHGPASKASRAARTARSMSSGDPSGDRPTSASVAGERTSRTDAVAGVTQRLPMNKWSYSSIIGSP